MERPPTGLEEYPPHADASTGNLLAVISVVLAVASIGSLGIGFAAAAVGQYLHNSAVRGMNMACGFLVIVGALLALLGLVFGVVGLLNRGARSIYAVIGTIVCASVVVISIGLVLLGLIVNRHTG